MPNCIKVSEYDPSVHVIVSGPYSLEECLSNCGAVNQENEIDHTTE